MGRAVVLLALLTLPAAGLHAGAGAEPVGPVPAEPQPSEPRPAEGTGAEEELTAEPRFSFRGYGTLGLVHSSEERADFVANPLRPDGAGRTREWSAEPDSRLGLQLSTRVTPKLSAVVQVVIEQQPEDDQIGPTLEWANLQYSVTDDLTLRLGRLPLAAFGVSEFRKVGYANPWVRPPVELYGLVPIFHNDGIELAWRHRFGSWTHDLQAGVGRSDFDLEDDVTVEATNSVLLRDSFVRGGLSFHVTLWTTELTVDLPGLFDAFRSFGAEGRAIAERFEADEERADFASVGAEYDPGSYFVRGELGRLSTSSFVVGRTAGYVSAGRRWGRFTPYATYSEARADDPISTPGLSLSNLPPELVPLATSLNQELNDILASTTVQRTVSAGLRWDQRPGLALKLQVDRIDVGAGSFGSFVEREPGFPTGGSATVVSISTDFVF